MAIETLRTSDANSLPEQPIGKAPQGRESYRQILASSILIGGSSVLVVLIGLVRTKAMALMLGPAGFGLMGLFSAIADLFVAFAGMGLNASGVRQIAAAYGTGDSRRIARTAQVLRRTSFVLGILGAVALIALRVPASEITFGTDRYSTAIAVLACVVLFRLVAEGQGALLQGMRRIADLGKLNVIGTLVGTVIAIPVVYVLREDGLVPSLVCMAAVSIATSWWYARKVPVEPAQMNVGEVKTEAGELLKLGFAFMASAMLMMGAAYAVRAIVLRGAGLDAAGLYSAAWTLGGLYVAFVLQAMGADFYPRLVGVGDDDNASNRLVNEQTHVSMLLAGPGVIATLALAPRVIALFYTADFSGAVSILRWICLGMALRVVAWPMGFIIVARNHQRTFFAVELTWTIANVGLALILVDRFGADGAGMAFFLAYVLHTVLVYALVRRMTGFRWTPRNFTIVLQIGAAIALSMMAYSHLPTAWSMAAGLILTTLSCLYSLHGLIAILDTSGSATAASPLLRRLEPLRRKLLGAPSTASRTQDESK